MIGLLNGVARAGVRLYRSLPPGRRHTSVELPDEPDGGLASLGRRGLSRAFGDLNRPRAVIEVHLTRGSS